MDIRRRTQIGAIKKTSSGGGSTTGGSYTVNLNGQWEATTAVPNPDSTLYDGVYRSSSNYNVNNDVATIYITIKDCSSFKMYIRSYAESNYDYVMVSQLDKTITGSTSYSDTTLVKAHTRGNQQSGTALSNYTLVEFTGITSGEHTITVVYRKDSSQHSGDDRGYVLIEKMQAGGGSEGDDVIPEPIINIDNYLTIEARGNGLTASLSGNACEYCVDGDGNWKSLAAGTTTESINTGHTLSFRGNLNPKSSIEGIGIFTISKRCNLKGNCMSMLFGDNGKDNFSLSIKREGSFSNLFNGCINIVEVSENFLPATTLISYCYNNMFRGCTSLTTAPTLPANECNFRAYENMFCDCTSLNYIKMLATDISDANCLYNWVKGVASTGTFVKNPNMTTLPTGSSGIPSGWTVVNDGEQIVNIDNYLTIEARENGLTASLSKNACEYCVDGDGNWKSLTAGTATESINTGQTLSFRGNLTPNPYAGIGTFTISKKCNLKGNCMSMLFGDNAANNYSLSGKIRALYYLFYNCTNIVKVSSNFLPATTLGGYCYQNMFQDCTSLTTAPELPATTLTDGCYDGMFSGCDSLTTAPELPATTLTNSCYYTMFYNCTSLTTAPELPATKLTNDCYSSMFYGCSKLNYIKMLATDISASGCLNSWIYNVSITGTFVKNPAMTTLPTGDSGIPSGWTVINDGEESEDLVIDYNNLTQNDVDQIINYMVDNGWTTDNRIDVQVINSNITVLYRNTEYPITWIIRSDGGKVGGSFWLMLYTTDIYNMPYFAIDEESLGIRFED